jgi:hypothetical protein
VSQAKAKPARGPKTTYIDLAALDDFKGEALGVFCWSDVRPLSGVAGYLDWRLCGSLSQTLVSELFRGTAGETMLLSNTGRLQTRRIFVFGLGPSQGYDGSILRDGCKRAHDVMSRAGVKQIYLAAPATRTDKTLESTFCKVVQEELGGQVEEVLVGRV